MFRGQIGFVGLVRDGLYHCAAFVNEKLVSFQTIFYDRKSKASANVDTYMHFAVVTGEKFTLARPRLGKQYYVDKFNESEWHPDWKKHHCLDDVEDDLELMF
jgi:hypothetical protein